MSMIFQNKFDSYIYYSSKYVYKTQMPKLKIDSKIQARISVKLMDALTPNCI